MLAGDQSPITNFYVNGTITSGSRTFDIVESSKFRVTVSGSVTPEEQLQFLGSFKLKDDDDKGLSMLGLPPALPRNDRHVEIVNGISGKYAAAYIQIEDANAKGWNPNQTIPFKLNSPVDSVVGSAFNDAKDLQDSITFWAFTVSFGYQPEILVDNDPDIEESLLGGASEIQLLNTSHGFAVIFLETIREDPRAIGDLSLFSPSVLGNPVFQQQLRDGYRDLILGIVAHEIGHPAGSQDERTDHDEGGIMMDGAVRINGPNSDFSPKTVRRFRKATRWTR
jgi:hypothetical protein